MTLKQEKFCYYYCQTYNATEAYHKAYGCTESTAKGAGCVLLKKPEIKARIAEIRKEKFEELQIDADRVMEKLAEIAFSSKGDEYYRSADQLKALDILAKSLNMFEKNIKVKQEEVIKVELTDK